MTLSNAKPDSLAMFHRRSGVSQWASSLGSSPERFANSVIVRVCVVPAGITGLLASPACNPDLDTMIETGTPPGEPKLPLTESQHVAPIFGRDHF
jgi:hypothetical protein